MEKRCYWKELSEEGLLREPIPMYFNTYLNQYGGFESEEEAICALDSFNKIYEYNEYRDLVLIWVYN